MFIFFLSHSIHVKLLHVGIEVTATAKLGLERRGGWSCGRGQKGNSPKVWATSNVE